jgi:hypothetical protein
MAVDPAWSEIIKVFFAAFLFTKKQTLLPYTSPAILPLAFAPQYGYGGQDFPRRARSWASCRH